MNKQDTKAHLERQDALRELGGSSVAVQSFATGRGPQATCSVRFSDLHEIQELPLRQWTRQEFAAKVRCSQVPAHRPDWAHACDSPGDHFLAVRISDYGNDPSLLRRLNVVAGRMPAKDAA